MNPSHETPTPQVPAWASWTILVVFCAAILAWGLFTYYTVPDRGHGLSSGLDRHWDQGALPDVPSESIYSSSPGSTSQPAGRQIAPLPEAYGPAKPTPAPAKSPATAPHPSRDRKGVDQPTSSPPGVVP